jgi:hypothetical protein
MLEQFFPVCGLGNVGLEQPFDLMAGDAGGNGSGHAGQPEKATSGSGGAFATTVVSHGVLE